ncbi:TraR/DksA C4-type zinc finger protein [Natranaerofaba carboxydovora]|uniref:TraR/DksA C4-type zinc finger protein n=1 Tax=Natranaerofaba carboxydovora TaxID=2742683 RepID=UPI001F12DB3D|nr:TraR/DksA C4-type zinc finger protein [Natranaerofaba carboxydovora]UMZ73284.1 General stress protein 16O [Natranaerofaba carboxydovora]
MDERKQQIMKQRLQDIKKKLILRLSKDTNKSTELSFIDNHPADTSDISWEQLKDQVMENEDKKKIDEIDNALSKIEAGSYGDCEECDEKIMEERLEAVPYVRYCKNCAEKLDSDDGFDPKIRPIREDFERSDSRGDIWDQMKVYGSSGDIKEQDSEYKTKIDDGREDGIVQDIDREESDDE